MKQETFFKKRQALLDELDKLEKSTLKARMKYLAKKGEEIVDLGGKTDIPWRELNRMLKGLGVTPYGNTENFMKFLRMNRIPFDFDSEEGGDTLRGFYTTYSNFRLQEDE